MKIGVFLNYVGLGANLLHLSYCHQIAKKYGPIVIITLCENLKMALEDDPLIKDIIVIDGKNYRRVMDIFKLSKKLKHNSFEKLFIFYPSLRTYLAAKFANIKEVYSYPFYKKKKLHLINAAKEFTEKCLNIKDCPTETKIFINNEKKNTAKKIINQNYYNIVIGAGSSGPTTKWGEQNYIDLINKLNLEDNYFFYILCGGNEKNLSEKIISGVNKKNCVSLHDKNISEIIPLISLCKIYVGNDSFGHHVMSQSNIPSIILLLDTPSTYTDYSKNQFQIIPEGKKINEIKHDTAFNPNLIKIEQVYNKILEIKN
tara:strand:+ start:4625 stop:5566 length:942 start_codon:yes stop_codon:yes gene_type:complete